MNRIDELIAKYCADGVGHLAMGEVGVFVRGNGLQKSDLTDTGTPAIHYGQVHTHYGMWATQTKSFVDAAFGAKLRHAQPGDLVIATTSEDDEAVGKATAWLGKTSAAVSGDAFIFRHTLEPKYVAYFFQSEQFQLQKKRFISGAKVRRLSGDSLAKIRIAVPPLEIQQEIVRILDQFTELEAELEAELESRVLQYAHYRNALMDFTDTPNVSWLPMGEVGAFTRGRRFTKADVVTDGGIPSIHYGEIYTDYGVSATSALKHVRLDLRPSLRFALPGDVIIASVGETVPDVAKAVAWLGDQPVAIHDDTFLFRSELDPKFLVYYMQTDEYQKQKNQFVARAKVKRLSSEGLARIVIPVPSLDQQKRIVATLDKFDALVNDLSIGLPAELAARRQQYEHYRDRLLTFKEAA